MQSFVHMQVLASQLVLNNELLCRIVCGLPVVTRAGITLQDEGNRLQDDGITLQEGGIALQDGGVDPQEAGNCLQYKGIRLQ